jgi:uncharacterized protein YgbK (DUF1537 family)
MYAILADDLTGGGDAGVQFATAGLRTRTLLDDWTATDLWGADVAVISTGSRHLAPRAAYDRVHRAATRLHAGGVTVVYKKIDSTLRGPLAAELDAALDACELPLAVVCPAFPALGRTLQGGMLLVEGIPVAMTAASTDPVAPVRESHLPSLLAQGTRRPVHTVTRPEGGHRRDLLAAELAALEVNGNACGGASRIVVCDAEDDADLAAIVGAAQGERSRILLVGSAGMARPLAALLAARVRAQTARQVLVACGSLHPAARTQMHFLAQAANPYVKLLATPIPQDHAAYEIPGAAPAQSVPPEATTAVLPVAQLAGEAAAWLTAQGIAGTAGIVVTGGDTLYALLRALGARGVDLEREVIPGVPLGTIAGGSWAGLPLISKAGGFGGPALLLDAAELLLDLDRHRQKGRDHGA